MDLVKIKASLAAARDLGDVAIKVDVENDVVTLRGTVAKTQQMVKALQVVHEIEGVKQVKNLLKVSPRNAKN